MTEKIQVVARFKNSDPANPRFTKTASFEELYVEIAKTLPVDKVYIVATDPDGLGYSLREIGTITLDLLTIDNVSANEKPSPSLHSKQTMPSEPSIKPVIDRGEDFVDKPIVDPSPPPQPYAFGQAQERDALVFDKPRPQAELLAERGVQEPKVNKASKEMLAEQRAEREGKKTSKSAKSKAKKPKSEQTESDPLLDPNLPHPRSLGSKVRINKIVQATGEAAQSNFRIK